MMENAEKDHKELVRTHLEQKSKYLQQLRSWFFDLEDDNGHVTYDEFCEKLRDLGRAEAFATDFDMDIIDFKQFFHVLSHSGTQAVDLETFLAGCFKMKGP